MINIISFHSSTMETSTFFFIVIATLIISILFHRRNTKKLPPGPSFIYSNLLLVSNLRSKLEPVLRNLKSKYGPLITLTFGSHRAIFVGNHSLAHHFLIQNGAVFSDRPKTLTPLAQLNITSAPYGPTWRLLRRNLTTEVLNPTRIKSYSWARSWVLHILIGRLRDAKMEEDAGIITVVDHFQYAMFCLFVVMCFGEKIDERRVNEIASVQRRLLLTAGSGSLAVFTVFPKLGKFLFRNRWREFQELLETKDNVLIPLIKSRIDTHRFGKDKTVAYVDTLMNLHLPDGDKLTEKQMVTLCSEFLTAGTDTTATALQWIMANMVKYPDIQCKLYEEIVSVVGPPPSPPVARVVETETFVNNQEDLQKMPPPTPPETESFVNQEDLQKMPYLKAVILEGLQRHPPAHLLLPHRTTKDVEVEGHVIPEGSTVTFFVADMGWDPKVWDNPMEFKPERFLNGNGDGVFDISGSKGIKMMPFGVGRRICPGLDLAILHLEFFVANLIWFFDWTNHDGNEVDFSEKIEFTTVMKNPLRTQISYRSEKIITN